MKPHGQHAVSPRPCHLIQTILFWKISWKEEYYRVFSLIEVAIRGGEIMQEASHHGQIIRQYREQRSGMTQEELGRRIGKSRRTVVSIEQTSRITDVKLRRTLALALEIPPQLLGVQELSLPGMAILHLRRSTSKVLRIACWQASPSRSQRCRSNSPRLRARWPPPAWSAARRSATGASTRFSESGTR